MYVTSVLLGSYLASASRSKFASSPSTDDDPAKTKEGALGISSRLEVVVLAEMGGDVVGITTRRNMLNEFKQLSWAVIRVADFLTCFCSIYHPPLSHSVPRAVLTPMLIHRLLQLDLGFKYYLFLYQ